MRKSSLDQIKGKAGGRKPNGKGGKKAAADKTPNTAMDLDKDMDTCENFYFISLSK